ncbi:hypothetical protein GCM10009612_53830 [Streptomyces beijiangensis]
MTWQLEHTGTVAGDTQIHNRIDHGSPADRLAAFEWTICRRRHSGDCGVSGRKRRRVPATGQDLPPAPRPSRPSQHQRVAGTGAFGLGADPLKWWSGSGDGAKAVLTLLVEWPGARSPAPPAIVRTRPVTTE